MVETCTARTRPLREYRNTETESRNNTFPGVHEASAKESGGGGRRKGRGKYALSQYTPKLTLEPPHRITK